MELRVSFFIAVLIIAGYIIYAAVGVPSGGDTVGHYMGIIGLVLMLMTETLYTIRKRMCLIWAGPLRFWLSFHIITGITGALLALLHTAFLFKGIAGLAMILTILIMFSGFMGRYIYTAIPRTVAGLALADGKIPDRVARFQKLMYWWYVIHVPLGITMFLMVALHVVTTIYFGAFR